jgi:small subunit ribosomal protein S21
MGSADEVWPYFIGCRMEEFGLQVLVRDNNVDQAMRVLKKKMQREGLFRELKQRRAYEKPSEKRVREKAEAIRRSRKAARKQAQRDGLLPRPKPKFGEARPARHGRLGGLGAEGSAIRAPREP